MSVRALLRAAPLFAALSDDDLHWIAEHGRVVAVAAGEVLFAEGEAATRFYVLLEGGLVITKRVGAEQVTLATHRPGVFTGEVPLLAGSPYVATARATEPSRLLSFDAADFEALIARSPVVAHTILRTMAQRMQITETMVRGQEKLAALGKLAAGLAHELNNPAAAAVRAVGQLREALRGVLTAGGPLPSGASSAPLDALARSDREEAVGDWLEGHGFADSWELAPSLVEAGLDVPGLDGLAAGVPSASLGPTLRRLAAARTVSSLLDLLEGSTGRVSTLVKAIKTYSYMDQAAVQEVDVRDGLESTLTMLQHRLGAIEVIRDYDPQLPRITAHGSELNQVWTNLLDNAIDALGGTGQITIRTAREATSVLVEITDDGPGIPPEVQPRIFEPFFTTKGVGEGTGLGLDISRRIVVVQHHGEIAVTSRPRETRFTIRLPIVPPRDGIDSA